MEKFCLKRLNRRATCQRLSVKVYDVFSAVFCVQRCNDRDLTSVNQRFSSYLALIFGGFSDFAFPGFFCLAVREPLGNYPNKGCFSLLSSVTKNIKQAHMLFFRFFQKGSQEKFSPLHDTGGSFFV